jgi:hypothetical protein
MRSDGRLVIAILPLGTAAFAAQDVAGAVEGTVSKVDRGAKTIAVKTRDGSEESSTSRSALPFMAARIPSRRLNADAGNSATLTSTCTVPHDQGN